jgi:glycosyltransferase involved in cell wall biosynthesis
MSGWSICIVTQQYKSVISGVGLHARNLLTGLHRDGHCVTLLTQVTQHDDTTPVDVETLTVPVSFLQHSQARWIPLAWHFAHVLRQLDAKRHFDIVHFTDAREALLFAGYHQVVVGNVNDYYAAQLQPISYYRRYYADWQKRWLYYMSVHLCEHLTLRRLQALIANSDYTCMAIQRAYRLDRRRLFKCFKCIDLSLFDPSPRTDYSGKVVLFAGGNMQRKGLRTLIRAAPRVLAVQPDVQFRVVGSDVNLPKMQALCWRLGVTDHFKFTGWMPNDELRRLHHQASIFVMPSLVEAFGVALLEAMASGTPVVATRVGGIPELVQHGENGWLVEPDDPEELAEAILAVLGDPDLAARLGRNGQCTAQLFGLEQMLACTYRVYESVLGKPL